MTAILEPATPDAEAIRNRILQMFELAEAEEDAHAHPDLMTFVMVGAGPTGVELSVALAMGANDAQFSRNDD